jgi:hypothetical protein
MQPIPFPEQNDILHPGSTGAQTLPIFRDGLQIISCWQLTPEEMLEVAATGRVYVSVMTTVNIPPVLIMGQYPFTKTEH